MKNKIIKSKSAIAILALVCTIGALVGMCGIYTGLPIIAVATILSAYGTLMMAIFVGYSVYQSGIQHEKMVQIQMEIIEEMCDSRKPILKPLMRSISLGGGTPVRYTLIIKNVGLGPASEVNIWWHWSELPQGVVESEEKWPRTNPRGFKKLPPLGSNEVYELGGILDKKPPGYIYIKIEYKNTYKKFEELYYKCNVDITREDITIEEDLIVENISKEEWDKWLKLTKEQG